MNFNFSKQDKIILREIFERFSSPTVVPSSNLIISVASFFKNTPYQANSLEGDDEILTVNLNAFDCVTFVETVLAIVKFIRSAKKYDEDNFLNILRNIRYRDGVISTYVSRLHYFSEWMKQNNDKEIFTDITKSLGGEKKIKQLNWMSKHSALYSPLSKVSCSKNISSPSTMLEEITLLEQRLSQIGFFCIAKQNIKKITNRLQTGDFVGFSTSLDGLDIVHCGFVIIENHIPFLIHASSVAKKVVISNEDIDSYAKAQTNIDGILVGRN